MLGDEEAALDATQDAVVSIARHITGFDRRSRYTTWSYRIAANAALDEARRIRRRSRVQAIDRRLTTEPGREPAEDRVAQQPSHEGLLTEQLSLREALAQLPEDQRDALRLRHELDLDYAEIASILQIPIGTVRSRIARGRRALLVVLAGSGDPDVASRARVGNRWRRSGVEVKDPK